MYLSQYVKDLSCPSTAVDVFGLFIWSIWPHDIIVTRDILLNSPGIFPLQGEGPEFVVDVAAILDNFKVLGNGLVSSVEVLNYPAAGK